MLIYNPCLFGDLPFVNAALDIVPRLTMRLCFCEAHSVELRVYSAPASISYLPTQVKERIPKRIFAESKLYHIWLIFHSKTEIIQAYCNKHGFGLQK